MVTKRKKVKFKYKTRKDISNPWHDITHKEVMEKAGIVEFSDNYEVEELPNGRITIKPANSNKKNTKEK